jgi:hypothetical protein
MKTALLFAGSGSLVIITSHDSLTNPALLERLRAKGIGKFIAYEIPVEVARARYGGHFQVAVQGLHESDDLHVLDVNGERAFRLFRFSEFGAPIMFEGDEPS